jgi:hypothetical protein
MKHNIEALRERFYNLLDTLMKDYHLESAMDESCPEDIEDCWDGLRSAREKLEIWTGTGCTKFIIGDSNYDYIIKFQPPFADINDVGDCDYCAREVEIYNKAVEEGFADKFAWCAKLFDYETPNFVLPVYVMEYCQCNYEGIDDDMNDWHYSKYCTSHGIEKSDEAYQKYDEDKWDRQFDERMMEWAYSVWGLDYNAVVDPGAKTIAQFMREMFINDIHCGNWGWCKNKLVLVDYSGFGDSFEGREICY